MPPRCRWPSVVTRVSNPVMPSIASASCCPTPPRRTCPNASSSAVVVVSSPAPASCVNGQPSLTTTMEKSLPRACRCRISSAQRSTVSGNSGISTTSAPPAMPLVTASQPAWRPMTSTTITRSCDSAVVCRRSIASVAIETAVSNPNVWSVPAMSLSIVFGTPITGRPCSTVQPCRDPERVLAADGDQGVELLERLTHGVDASLHAERVRAARVQDRPAARQDARDGLEVERAKEPFDEPAPAAQHADRLGVVVDEAVRRRANDGVEPRAVTPAGQHSHAHPYLLDRRSSSRTEWQLQRDPAQFLAARPHSGDEVGGRLRERRVAMPREADLARRNAARGVERHHSRDAVVDREARDQGRADARRDHALHRTALVAAEDDVRLDAARAQQRLDAVGAAAVGHERQPADLGERGSDLALRERTALLGEQDVGIAQQLDVLERALGWHEREREVQAPALDEGEQLVLVGRFLQPHLDARAYLHETAHDIGQDPDRDALERADA